MSYSNFILQLLWSHFFCPLHIDFTFQLHIDFPQLNVFIVFFSVFFDSFNSLCNWWEQSKKYSSSPFRLMRINTPYHTLFSHSYHFMSLYSSLILFLQSYPFFFCLHSCKGVDATTSILRFKWLRNTGNVWLIVAWQNKCYFILLFEMMMILNFQFFS